MTGTADSLPVCDTVIRKLYYPNPAGQTAHVTWTLRDRLGQTVAIGYGTLDAGSQHALFIDEIQELASDLVLPAGFLQTMRYGSLQIDSDQALSITALRMITNQRNDILFTSLPIADLTLRFLTNQNGDFLLTTFPVTDMTPAAPVPAIFPHLADAGGYRTEFIFLSVGGASQVQMNSLGTQGLPLLIAK